MKKHILLFLLLCVCTMVSAIDYPAYNPRYTTYEPFGTTTYTPAYTAQSAYGFYSVVATGGTTTTGEGTATRPRRTAYSGSTPPDTGTDGDTWTDSNGKKWRWDSALDEWVGDRSQEDAGNPNPVGAPTVLFLFAALSAFCIALRQRTQKA